jgi:radical SAM family RiPP maturation amino acid epimerase
VSDDDLPAPVEYEPPVPRISDEAAEVKRFFERWSADPSFRELTVTDPAAAAAECGISINPETFRQNWDPRLPEKDHAPLPPAVREFLDHIDAKIAYRDRVIAEGGAENPRLSAWRRRQIARGLFEVGEARNSQIVHAPFALELNVGCSVGCWFCGISAPKLTDIFAYTRENRDLWRNVLSVLHEEIGNAASRGFCYWATDPFDNPDYERFVTDFHDILGAFPQTTTALALRDPARTRRLLRLSERRGCFSNRFSIFTLRRFKEVHAEFSPRELRAVECIPQNKESDLSFANSGRARERAQRSAKRQGSEFSDPAGTIACVSGFLINMVERSIKLITPCRATDSWPLGYVIVDEARFGSAPDLQREIRRMIEEDMPERVEELPRLAFADQLVYKATTDGFELSTEHRKSRHEHPALSGCLKELGRLVRDGKSNTETIGLVLSYHGIPAEKTVGILQKMFENGLLLEGPGLVDS